MDKKRFRKRIESLQQKIDEHEEKIDQERNNPNPDEGLIRHWQTEITAFKKNIEKAENRLRRKQ